MDQVPQAIVDLAVPAVVLLAIWLLYLLVRRRIQVLMDRRLAGDASSWQIGKTFRVSFGAPGTDPAAGMLADTDLDSIPERAQGDVRPLDPSRREHYRRLWKAAEGRFAVAPAEAVREAHRLAYELVRERGSGVFVLEQGRIDNANLVTALGDIYGRIENARAAARGVASANAHEAASSDDLRLAMDQYRDLFERMLAEERLTREL